MNPSRRRFHVLDLLRGFLLLNMAAYHFLYDWVFIFQQPCAFMTSNWAYLWQQAICSGFILLAGCSCTLSRRPARRGRQILLCGLLITVVTVSITPEEQILFGILHFLGLAYLLAALLQPVLQKLPARPMFVLSIVLFACTKGLYYGYLGFFDFAVWSVPDLFYQYQFLFMLGLPGPNFVSSDYFPLIPWLFLFLAGYWAAPGLIRSKWFRSIQHWSLPILNWIGRNTLWLYMLHQPVIYGLLSLLF